MYIQKREGIEREQNILSSWLHYYINFRRNNKRIAPQTSTIGVTPPTSHTSLSFVRMPPKSIANDLFFGNNFASVLVCYASWVSSLKST